MNGPALSPAPIVISALGEVRVDKGKEAGLAVSGQVLIPAGVPGFGGAAAHVRLEELKGEDTAARVVAETIIQDVSHEGGAKDTTLPFTIELAPGELSVSPENDYALRVWVDYDGDGERGPGDLYSEERYSVFTRRSEEAVTIKVVQR